jgi:hypothetical protein
VLYPTDESSGFNGWTLPKSWDTVSDQLVNDGSVGGVTNQAHPPAITRYTPNYAVEAVIQMVRVIGHDCGYPSFGLVVRSDQDGFYAVGVAPRAYDVTFNTYGDWAAAITDLNLYDDCVTITDRSLVQSSVTVDTTWHRFRAEVRGNDIRLLIDGRPAVETTDNHHLHGNAVGLWSNGVVLNVSSFTVIAL